MTERGESPSHLGAETLEHLRAIWDELREIREEQREQRGDLGSIERGIALMTQEMGEMSWHLDRIDGLNRIESHRSRRSVTSVVRV